jgi:hypothetical protein
VLLPEGARVERCREALQTLLDETMRVSLARCSAWNRDSFPCEGWAARVELVAPSDDVFNVEIRDASRSVLVGVGLAGGKSRPTSEQWGCVLARA